MRFRADADMLRLPPRVDREPLLRFRSNEIACSNRSSCPCTCVRSLRSWLTTLLRLVILPLSWNNFIVMDWNPFWPPHESRRSLIIGTRRIIKPSRSLLRRYGLSIRQSAAGDAADSLYHYCISGQLIPSPQACLPGKSKILCNNRRF